MICRATAGGAVAGPHVGLRRFEAAFPGEGDKPGGAVPGKPRGGVLPVGPGHDGGFPALAGQGCRPGRVSSAASPIAVCGKHGSPVVDGHDLLHLGVG